MTLTDAQITFLEGHHDAAMVTIGSDGMAKTARVAVGLVDGHLWSSATADRVRTRRLRRDPRCTLFVFAPGYAFLNLETTVRLLEGPEVPEDSVRLMRVLQDRADGPISWFGEELEETAFKQVMVDQQRLLYEFEVERAYGIL